MSEQSYIFATRQIRRAKQCLRESQTVYEGLHSAFKQGLLRIDIDRDLPDELADTVRKLVDDLPMRAEMRHNDTCASAVLTAAVRKLDPARAHILSEKILALPEYAVFGQQRRRLRAELC